MRPEQVARDNLSKKVQSCSRTYWYPLQTLRTDLKLAFITRSVDHTSALKFQQVVQNQFHR